MPALNIFLIIIFCFYNFGCFEKKPANHGMSNIPISQFTYRGVVEKTIKLKFKVVKSNSSTIQAIAETEYDYNHPVKFEWKLGEGLKLSDGNLTGEIAYLRKNTPYTFTIKVNGFESVDPRFIRFEVIGTHESRRIYADGIIASQDEKSFEKIVQEIEEYKKYND